MQTLFRRACALSLALSCCAFAQASDFMFTAQGDQPIATLTRVHGMVRGVVDTPLVTVYGDGRVRVERAPYMRNPGITEFKLDAAGLDQFVGELASVFEVDTQRLQDERDSAARAMASSTGEQFVTLDSTTTEISIALASFARQGEAPAAVRKSIRFADVQEQAARYSGLASLQSLAKVEKVLLALMDASPANEGADNEK